MEEAIKETKKEAKKEARDKQKRTTKIKHKAKAWAQAYIKNNFNATEASMQLYNAKNRRIAENIGSTNLSKPIFQSAIIEAMEKHGLNDGLASEIHVRNLAQSKNFAASNGALEMYHKIKGLYAPEKKLNVSLELKDERDIDAKLNEIMNELKVLNESSSIPHIDALQEKNDLS